MAAAASSLQSQAQALVQAVSVFDLGASGQAGGRSSVRPAPCLRWPGPGRCAWREGGSALCYQPIGWYATVAKRQQLFLLQHFRCAAHTAAKKPSTWWVCGHRRTYCVPLLPPVHRLAGVIHLQLR